MTMGPEDLVALGLHYLPSLLLALVLAVGALTAIARTGRMITRPLPRWLRVFAPLVPIGVWIVYLTVTLKLTTTLTLLDSESAGVAELVYQRDLKPSGLTVKNALRLTRDHHLPPNVRFYAACFIADMMATNSDAEVEAVLQLADRAPAIDAQFIGSNSLTEDFHVPGRAQPHLSVRQVVERRLRHLRADM
jgi:hypothetical protein